MKLVSLAVFLFIIQLAVANFFDFFHQEQRQPEGRNNNPFDYEQHVLQTHCDKYLCPDTLICVEAPKFCPCKYPSSQLRCFLPDGRYLCISKPSGEEFGDKYNDPQLNWKIDAKDDNVRDCGWVNRVWRGQAN